MKNNIIAAAVLATLAGVFLNPMHPTVPPLEPMCRAVFRDVYVLGRRVSYVDQRQERGSTSKPLSSAEVTNG